MEQIGFLSITADDLQRVINEAVTMALQNWQPTPSPELDSLEHIPRIDVLSQLGISHPTLRRLEKSGRLKPRRIGRKVIFLRSDVERFLEGKL